MKVESPGIVHGPGESPQRRAGGGERSGTPADGGGDEGSRSPHDEVVLFGVPERELSPAARAALIALGGEVGELRAALDEARRRIVLLEHELAAGTDSGPDRS